MDLDEKKQKLFEQVLDGYRGYFDIYENSEYPQFIATAQFHSRSEKYVLTEHAKLWAAEAHEYVFFAECENLDIVAWQELASKATEYGLALVKPHSEHMYSYISLVVLADSVDETALKEIKKTKFHKSFKFSIHGWADLRCAVVNLSGNTIITNSAGKDMRKSLKRYL